MKELDFTLESGEDIELSMFSEPSMGFDISESPVEIGGGGTDIPETTALLKGDGSGGAVAATAGVDYQAPILATPEDYGAIGDGITDDTTAIANCLAAENNVLFTKKYKVNGHANSVGTDYYALAPRSNSVLWFAQEAQLTINGNGQTNYTGILLHDVDNVIIHGAKIVGDKTAAVGSGYQGNGIKLRGATNVVIEDCDVSNCITDGIMLTSIHGDTEQLCKNISVRNCKSHSNYRMGLTVAGSEDILIENCEFYGMNGISPQSGIDLEPDSASIQITRCKITNCYFHDNTGYSIVNSNGTQTDITLENCNTEKVFINSGFVTVDGGTHKAITAASSAIGAIVKNAKITSQIVSVISDMTVDNCVIDGDGTSVTFNINDGTIADDVMFIKNSVIKNAKNITANKGVLILEGCRIIQTLNYSWSTSGNISAYSCVFDFSNANVGGQPISVTTLELYNCDFYTNNKGQFISVSDGSTVKTWANNRFHNSITTLSYKANKLINNIFNFAHTKIASSATGEMVGNVWSDLNEFYTKPASGIPASDLASAVQTSLGRADELTDVYINALIDAKLGGGGDREWRSLIS